MIEIFHYVNPAGVDEFEEWLSSLKDQKAAARIAVRITRIEAGNFGDCKFLQEGVWELRIDWGPGYRVYYGMVNQTCVLLLWGGDKRSQARDIKRAIKNWKDFLKRSEQDED